ncbi:MAG: cytochrome c biogenesis protein CcsA [Flavobacteriales bacterium]|nr:cytochrome c biogenesis protein CcsA [Flavobacteriales bacterium]
MLKHWWKILAVILVLYAIITGFLIEVPALPILHESIRNLFFHVTMWFAMIFLCGTSWVYSMMYLSSSNIKHDIIASEAAHVGVMFGAIGIVTGMIWANFTWGAPWVNDPKLNGAAITMLIYLAYFVLRNSMDEEQKKAKVSAVYNIFAFIMLIVFLYVLPRMTDSLHPGNGGNGTFSDLDIDNTMRTVFYPAIIGWTLLGVWFLTLRVRIKKLSYQKESELINSEH